MMQRNQWLWLVPVLLLMIGLSAAHLDDDAIWFDEWITYFITDTGGINRDLSGTPCEAIPGTQIPPLDMICLAAIDNSWPPAFFSLLMVWNKLVSFGALLSDRMLALLIGLLAVSATYRLGKRLFDHQTGLIAALLLASNAFFIYYLHEVRGYTLYVFFPALSGWLYWQLLDSYRYSKRAVRWGFAFSIAGTLYSHYIGAAVVLGIGIYHVLFARPDRVNSTYWQRKSWSGILKLWLNGCFIYAPWVAVLIISFYNESLTQRSLDTLTLMQNMIYGFSNNLWWIAIPALLISLTQRQMRQIRFLWVWLLTILLVSVLGNIFANFLFHPRHIMGLMPAFMLLIAVGAIQAAQLHRAFLWLIVGIWVGAGIVYSATPDFMNALPRHISTIPLPAMTLIADTVEQCAAADDLVVLGIDTPDDEWVYTQPMEYYLPDTKKLTFLGLLVTDERGSESPLLPEDLRAADYATRVTAMTDAAPNVWLFTLPDLPLQAEVLTLDNLLQETGGYRSCGNFIDQAEVLGVLYTRTNDASCARVLTCAEND